MKEQFSFLVSSVESFYNNYKEEDLKSFTEDLLEGDISKQKDKLVRAYSMIASSYAVYCNKKGIELQQEVVSYFSLLLNKFLPEDDRVNLDQYDDSLKELYSEVLPNLFDIYGDNITHYDLIDKTLQMIDEKLSLNGVKSFVKEYYPEINDLITLNNQHNVFFSYLSESDSLQNLRNFIKTCNVGTEELAAIYDKRGQVYLENLVSHTNALSLVGQSKVGLDDLMELDERQLESLNSTAVFDLLKDNKLSFEEDLRVLLGKAKLTYLTSKKVIEHVTNEEGVFNKSEWKGLTDANLAALLRKDLSTAAEPELKQAEEKLEWTKLITNGEPDQSNGRGGR